MGFMDKLKSAANQAAQQLKATGTELSHRLADEVGKYKNRDFLTALISASVLMARADGNISQEERSALMNFLSISQELKVFKTPEVIEVFNQTVALFDFDPRSGEVEALNRVGKIKSNEGAAKTLVRVTINLANADGNFSKEERSCVELICRTLGLSPAEFLTA